MSPPRRSWNGATYVLSLAAEPEEATWPLANGGTATTHAVSRGQLIAVSEGPNRSGYLICDWCGWGTPVAGKTPTKHPHLLRDKDCTGPLQARSLAHRYETDIVEISFDALAAPFAPSDQWRSTLYALLEGVSGRLQISRDDIDGTLYPTRPWLVSRAATAAKRPRATAAFVATATSPSTKNSAAAPR
jgi:hypothetical protein